MPTKQTLSNPPPIPRIPTHDINYPKLEELRIWLMQAQVDRNIHVVRIKGSFRDRLAFELNKLGDDLNTILRTLHTATQVNEDFRDRYNRLAQETCDYQSIKDTNVQLEALNAGLQRELEAAKAALAKAESELTRVIANEKISVAESEPGAPPTMADLPQPQ